MLGFLLTLLACVLFGCQSDNPITSQVEITPEEPESPDGPSWFEDVTDRVGLNFIHDPGTELDKYLLYQVMGSGCAIADLDGDGRADLILLTNGGPNSKSTNKLFRQKPDGTFEDVSGGSGLDFPGHNMGIAIGDVNNDGRPDILITQVGGVRLLLNRGGMKFQDVTEEAGLSNPGWGTSAAFVDFDRDGWLDLVVVNYLSYDPTWACFKSTGEGEYCAPNVFPGSVSRLFRNRGGESGIDSKNAHVSFEEVTMKSRLGEKPGPGLGVVVADLDGDGWPDIFVTNDGRPNHLWINNRDGTFNEEASTRGVAWSEMGRAYAGMGVAVGDIANNGLLDLFVTHLSTETNTLWKQGPQGHFRDHSAAWELTPANHRKTGFGTLMADFNNDGWLDLAIVNGGVGRDVNCQRTNVLSSHWEPYGERNQVFTNTGCGAFREISHNNPSFCGYSTVARGLACGDIDGDGAPDLLVNSIGERARLFRNIAPKGGHWVTVRAIDPRLNRDAIGAQVVARTGEKQRVRVIGSGDSYLSASPTVAHFGLGSAAVVDSYEVRWPDGSQEHFPGGKIDRPVVLRKGEGSK
jgi:hypothetical protein